MCSFQCCHLVTIGNISAWCLKGQCIFIKSGSTSYTWCNPIMSYNWMWGFKKCNNSGWSWMCNRQKLNENQMCNKPNVCGIAHLYHIVQFPCVLCSEPTTWALCTASTASLNITQNASAHIWKTVMNSSVFTIQLKRFLLVQRHSGLFVENNHH